MNLGTLLFSQHESSEYLFPIRERKKRAKKKKEKDEKKNNKEKRQHKFHTPRQSGKES